MSIIGHDYGLRLNRFLRGVIPKPGAVQPGEGSPVDRRVRVGDPSLRLKSGCAQDDAANQKEFEMSHYPIMLVLVISIGFLVPKAAAQSDQYSKMA